MKEIIFASTKSRLAFHSNNNEAMFSKKRQKFWQIGSILQVYHCRVFPWLLLVILSYTSQILSGGKIILLQILRPDLTLSTRDAWRHCAPTFGWEKTFIDLLFGEKEMSFCLLRFNWFFPWRTYICQNNTVKMIISRLIVYVESSKVVVVFCCLSLSGESTKTSI